MAWVETRQRAMDAIISRLSQSISYTIKGSVAVTIDTEFRAKYTEMLEDGIGNAVESVRPRLIISASLIPGTLSRRPEKGDTFTAAGTNYRVAEVQDSGRGYWICYAVEAGS